MNTLEIDALSQPLSNEAIALYCVCLRPQVTRPSQKVTIKNKAIIQLLNNKTETITLGRQVSALLRELNSVGLIKGDALLDFTKSLNNHEITLPLIQLPNEVATHNLHQQHTKMTISWRPSDEYFSMLCDLIGLIDKDYSADELGEFIAYWLGRPEITQTPYQWTQKFVLQLKQRRIRRPAQLNESKAGHQSMTPKAALAFDENVEKLVHKYSGN